MWVDEEHWVQDILCTDPQDLQKSLNRQEDLHCSSCRCCQRFSAPAPPPPCQPAAKHKSSAKAAVYCQKSFWAVYLVSALSSRVLSIVCKSSNQHAQILFNFTASRVALISSSHLGCLLFKSNGWFLWKGGGWGVIAVLSFACKQFEVSSVTPQQIIKFAFENKEPGSMYKHINTAVLCIRLLVSRHSFCFLIEYEMYYFCYCLFLDRWMCWLQSPKCPAAVSLLAVSVPLRQ